MKAASFLIDFNAILFFMYGLGFLFFPEYLSALVTGDSPSNSSAIMDMRATYGGISLGFGLLLAYCARCAKTTTTGLWGIILVVGGMALGRLAGIIIDGSPNTIMYIFLILELTIVTVALAALPRVKLVVEQK